MSPVNTWIDTNTGRVVAGADIWPFDLELATGTARIEVEGSTYLVRPLLWVERLTLARLAPDGGPFTQRQLLRAALGNAAELPANGAALAVLAALAEWLNREDAATDPLPLDAPGLTRIALQVCRTAGLTLSQVDALPAAAVALLWRSALPLADTASSAEADGFNPTTRIVVLPDGPESGLSPSEPATQSQEASPLQHLPGPVEAPSGVAEAWRADRVEGLSPPAAGEFREFGRVQVEPAEAGVTLPERPAPSSPVTARSIPEVPNRRAAFPAIPRFRILTDDAQSYLASGPARHGIATTHAKVLVDAPGVDAPVGNARVLPPREWLQPGDGFPTVAADRLLRDAEAPDSPSAQVLPPLTPAAAAPATGLDAASGGARPLRDDREAIFDELARRLEQAAMDLGIDTGG